MRGWILHPEMSSEKITYTAIEQRLLNELPQFRAAFRDELEDSSGLPHVVFGWLTSFVVKEYQKGLTGPGTPFSRALSFLEEAMGSKDVEVQNLVWVSFLENLDIAEKKDLEGIKAKLGPNLKATLKKVV